MTSPGPASGPQHVWASRNKGAYLLRTLRGSDSALAGSNVQQAQAWQPGRPASGSAHNAVLLRVHRRGGLGPTLAWLAARHGERAP